MRSRLQVIEMVLQLGAMFPKLEKTVTAVKAVLQVTRGFDYPEFEEPKTLLNFAQNGEVEIDLNIDLIAGWICHMSHSSRIRMELLEDAIIRLLVGAEVIVPAMLARAHIEAAAWAAYTNEELVKVSENNSWEKIKNLIPKMLYGTAIAREAKHLPEAERDPLWLEVTSVMNAVDALGNYFGNAADRPKESLRVLYAALSDYAHPTLRGVRHLFEPIAETGEAWTIAYNCEEQVAFEEAEFILNSLLVSMRLGHSAALLTRLGTIEETEKGIRYIKPEVDNAMGIWQHIMLGALPQADA